MYWKLLLDFFKLFHPWENFVLAKRDVGSTKKEFRPVFWGSRQYYKFFINYILQLHVKSFIPVRQEPSFVLLGQNISHVTARYILWKVYDTAGIKAKQDRILSRPTGMIKSLPKLVITWSQLARIKFRSILPRSQQCDKLFINYILQFQHMKRESVVIIIVFKIPSQGS